MLSIGFYSSSEDEEDLIKSEACLKKHLRQQCNVFSLPDKKYVSYFRLNKAAVKYVLRIISSKLKEPTRRSAVSKEVKLTTTLRILAEGSYQKGVGNDINVNLCQSSVSDAFHECIDAMYTELCPRWISFVTNEEEKNEIKKYFFRNTGFPGVIGCIDGTHVAIIPPSNERRFKYLNRKGFYSLNVMVVCDHKLAIRYIQSHSPGSCHDSLIWNISDLKHHLKEQYQNGERNTWLLGDAGYPLDTFLMTPFRSTVNGSPESNFNNIHAKTRNTVERAIGVLKNRFRCLLVARQLHYTPEFVGKIISVCAALHNICIHFNIKWPEEHINEDMDVPDYSGESDSNASSLRLRIMNEFNT